MKKILLASVAISAIAGSAFANSKVTDAVNDINNALHEFTATDSSGEIAAQLESLLYMIDNHGAIDTISITNSDQTITYDGSSDVLLNAPAVNISTHDFVTGGEIADARTDLVEEVRTQFYGGSLLTEGSWSIAFESGAYALKGSIVADSHVDSELKGLTTALNTLNEDLVAPKEWNSTNVGTLNGYVEDVTTKAVSIADGLTSIADATASIASDDYLLRADIAANKATFTNTGGTISVNSGDAVAANTAVDVRVERNEDDTAYDYTVAPADQ